MSELLSAAQVLTTPPESRWEAVSRHCRPTLAYWMQTEVHVYAFSIAANVLLSLFPFLIVTLSVCWHVLDWKSALGAVSIALDDHFPGDVANHSTMAGFIRHNLRVAVLDRGAIQIFSIGLLLFVANGIFVPLEVAMNRAWGISRNRSYLKNQLVSLMLIFACGCLALFSTVLTGLHGGALGGAVFKIAAVPVSMLILFLIYWLLPNAKVPVRAVLPAAVAVGLALEALKYINLLTWPLWYRKLHAEYGPFTYSATIVLWSFLGAMVILAGAEWAARRGSLGQPGAHAGPAGPP